MKKLPILLMIFFFVVSGPIFANPPSSDYNIEVSVDANFVPPEVISMDQPLNLVGLVVVGDQLFLGKKSHVGEIILPVYKVNNWEIAKANYSDEYLKRTMIKNPQKVIRRIYYCKLE